MSMRYTMTMKEAWMMNKFSGRQGKERLVVADFSCDDALLHF
jgi:hypothetical protein